MIPKQCLTQIIRDPFEDSLSSQSLCEKVLRELKRPAAIRNLAEFHAFPNQLTESECELL